MVDDRVVARSAGIVVRPYEPERDGAWAEGALERGLGGRLQARRGELVDVLDLPGLVAERAGERLGLLTYHPVGEECEVAALVADERQGGVGSALLEALRPLATSAGCARLWLVTTNDNVDALRFYQRRGFVLRHLRPGAIDEARRVLKPTIGAVGEHGIPIRDELELELSLREP